jgi:hypothetical protein
MSNKKREADNNKRFKESWELRERKRLAKALQESQAGNPKETKANVS